MKNKSFFSTLLQVVLLCLLLAAFAVVFVFASRYTNGFTGGFISFYLQTTDGEQIAGESERELTYGQRHLYHVVYTFSFATDESGYTVKVVPNVTDDTDFDFSAGDKYYSYGDVGELTNYFDIVREDTYFTIAANMELSQMLSLVYGSSVSGVPDTVDSGLAYYTLVVQSNADASVKVDFKLRSDTE